MQLNKTSSAVLVLTLDDKSYLDYLCVTWFYYEGEKKPKLG